MSNRHEDDKRRLRDDIASSRDPAPRLDEAELRENADYIEAIGDEEADDQAVEEGLEQYGIDRMDDSHFESEPTAPADHPDWLSEDARKRSGADQPHNRNPDGMYSDDHEKTPRSGGVDRD